MFFSGAPKDYSILLVWNHYMYWNVVHRTRCTSYLHFDWCYLEYAYSLLNPVFAILSSDSNSWHHFNIGFLNQSLTLGKPSSFVEFCGDYEGLLSESCLWAMYVWLARNQLLGSHCCKNSCSSFSYRIETLSKSSDVMPFKTTYFVPRFSIRHQILPRALHCLMKISNSRLTNLFGSTELNCEAPLFSACLLKLWSLTDTRALRLFKTF